jgi:molybdate transport system permease protein
LSVRRSHFRGERLVLAGTGGILALALVLPLAALGLSTTEVSLGAALSHPLVWPALRLSLLTTLVSLVVVVVLGTPLSWTLARSRSPIARTVETLVELPIVVPPAVAGVALLLAFGRHGVFAGLLYPEGTSLAFTTGAVVLAEIFVSAPLYLQAANAAFRRVDGRFFVVAQSLGASPLRVFVRIALPLAAPSLVAGAAMSWARSLGEFGATLMFAGNLQGVTQTLPVAVYTVLESDLGVAQALSVLLVLVALLLLLVARVALSRAETAEAVR